MSDPTPQPPQPSHQPGRFNPRYLEPVHEQPAQAQAQAQAAPPKKPTRRPICDSEAAGPAAS
ncbi:hypothetical protein ACMFMG_003395 [Clarireedia jacksonii]